MKKFFTIFQILIFTLIFAASISYSQDLEETLSHITGDASKAYVDPVISAFGANLNSGWVHKTPQAKIFGVDIEIGVVAMGSFFSDDDKTFSSSGTFRFNEEQARYIVENSGYNPDSPQGQVLVDSIRYNDYTVGIFGPTIVGNENDSVRVHFRGANISGNVVDSATVVTPVYGFLDDLSILPMGAPQITLGTVYGTSIAFRFLPSIKINDDLGKFSYFGFGIQHNPAMWIPYRLPVQLSLGFFTQKLKVGDVFESNATTFGLFASKTFGGFVVGFTPYIGLAFESSNVDVSYDITIETPAGPQPSKIEFNMDGENSFRGTIGAAFKLTVLTLSIDYSFSSYSALSAGLGFRF